MRFKPELLSTFVDVFETGGGGRGMVRARSIFVADGGSTVLGAVQKASTHRADAIEERVVPHVLA